MSVSRLTVRRLFALSTILLGMLLAGTACTHDPNKESETTGCTYNQNNNTCY